MQGFQVQTTVPDQAVTISERWRLRVAIDAPLAASFDYLAPSGATPDDVGLRVVVPFGTGRRVGLIMAVLPLDAFSDQDSPPVAQLKAAETILRDLPALPVDWINLCLFSASYYQAAPGEALLQAIPTGLRKTDPTKRRALKHPETNVGRVDARPALTAGQAVVVDQLSACSEGYSANLLFGITGSGKTEVYLRLIESALARGQQVLLLVPEINLTPLLEARVTRRFPDVPVVSLHSEVTEAARARHFTAALNGVARIVIGTRLAVFTPMPKLGLIIVDEEHDPAYKQLEGMRYHARDLAVWRAYQRGVPVLLGSATPSPESWANVQTGRYRRLDLLERAHADAVLPEVTLLDTRRLTLDEGLSATLLEELAQGLAAGEQSLLFINRRGYAPVLTCTACGWISNCRRCAAHRVVHRIDRTLRCHHCGDTSPIPRQCPDCGNADLRPLGRGTQRVEEALQKHFPQARILRVDRDVASTRKQWETLEEQIRSQEADILVGTQMLAKGHDFPALTRVGVVGADSGLFAADWRAPERLFAQLMQVAGRAGRANRPGRVIVQTEHPEHPLYQCLLRHDVPGFLTLELNERQRAGFPPYAAQAIVRAEGKQLDTVLAFLQRIRSLTSMDQHPEVFVYDPVPMRMVRLAGRERAQLLVESPSRLALQAFLNDWLPRISQGKGTTRGHAPGGVRWGVEVDPLEC
jgi:primosomal protein N' (replication factor Y) (superfamily II helicase)